MSRKEDERKKERESEKDHRRQIFVTCLRDFFFDHIVAGIQVVISSIRPLLAKYFTSRQTFYRNDKLSSLFRNRSISS